MPTAPKFFRSGSSRRSAFEACVEAGVPAGVSLADLSRPMLKVLEHHLSIGASVFVDSGAFTAFQRGARLTQNDFERVLGVYERLAPFAQPGRLSVVAPDVIADQDATLGLIEKFSERLTRLAASGIDLLVPLQKGGRTITAFHREICSILPGVQFRAALPSNAAALSSSEALDFVRDAQPARIHFLGAGRSAKFRRLLARVMEVAPNCHVSFDAAVIRSVLGKLKACEQGVGELAHDLLSAGRVDEGELAMALRARDSGALRVLAETIAGEGRGADGILIAIECEMMANPEADPLEAAERVEPALDQFWPLFVRRWCLSEARRQWRTLTLASLPEFRDDPTPLVDHPEQSALALAS